MKLKPVFIVAIVLVAVIACAYYLFATSREKIKLTNTYNNSQYGFEFQYPSNWSLDQKNQLSFKTSGGYIAYVSILENSNPDVTDHRQQVKIGSEQGFENSWIGCEFSNPCYAIFEFKSLTTIEHGFEIQVMINNLKDQDVDRNTFYPYPHFSSDIRQVEEALSTLTYKE